MAGDPVFSFSCGGFEYRAQRMNALDQGDVLALLSPMLAAGVGEIVPLVFEARKNGTPMFAMSVETLSHLAPVFREFSKMSGEDRRFVYQKCLSTCERKIVTGQKIEWAPIWSGERAMFSDLNDDFLALIMVVWNVLLRTFSGFFPGGLSALTGEAPR